MPHSQIPNKYDAPESVAYSLMVAAIGISVPVLVVWAARAFGNREVRERPPAAGHPLAEPWLAAEGRHEQPDDAGPPIAQLPVPAEPLTDREMEILRELAAGKPNKEIARDLVISLGTVKTHTNNVYRKLGARNRTEAVAVARRLQLI